MQDRLLAAGSLLVVRVTFVLLLVSYHIMYQLPLFLGRAVFHHCPIGLLHLAVLEHLVETGKGLTGLGKNNKTAHGTVQPVRNTNENIAGLIVLFLQILLYSL